MNNTNQELNGLMDGISLIEKDRKESENLEAVVAEDMIYSQENCLDSFEELYREEEFAILDYDPDSFNAAINLLSVEEEKIEEDWLNDAIF